MQSDRSEIFQDVGILRQQLAEKDAAIAERERVIA
jgi:uncharacterized protein (DUF3084 family)